MKKNPSLKSHETSKKLIFFGGGSIFLGGGGLIVALYSTGGPPKGPFPTQPILAYSNRKNNLKNELSTLKNHRFDISHAYNLFS